MDTKGILTYDEDTCRLCMTHQSGVIDINSRISTKTGRIIDMVRYCFDVDVSIPGVFPAYQFWNLFLNKKIP